MDYVSHIGFIAAILTTIAFIPQVMKTHRTKQTKGLSLIMYIVFSIGVFLWMVYGIILGLVPVIVANALIFTSSLYILILKIRHG